MTDTILNPMPELEGMLKKLRLSGVLNSLAVRNREAIENKMTYPEFLALLVQDEILRRDKNRFASRIKKSGFKGEKTLESFDFSFNPKINVAEVKEIATCQFISEKVPVILMGPCGTGKSHLAQAIGHCAIRQGIDVIFMSQSRLLNTLQSAKAAGDYDKQLAKLVKVPLLVVDDFGLKPLRTPQDEYFHELIGERYENGATLITSNLDINEWQQAFTNQLLGAATIDRLRHGAYQVVLDGKSYRSASASRTVKGKKQNHEALSNVV